MQASKHFTEFKQASHAGVFPCCTSDTSRSGVLQRFAGTSISPHREPRTGKQKELNSPVGSPLSAALAARCHKENAAQADSQGEQISGHQKASASHTRWRQGAKAQQAVTSKKKKRLQAPAAMADPLGAFANQVGVRQRSLQSGLNLLKGKASDTVRSGLQPVCAAHPQQLAHSQHQPRSRDGRVQQQPNGAAEQFEQYAYQSQQEAATTTQHAPQQQKSSKRALNTHSHADLPDLPSQSHAQAAQIRPADILPVAIGLDPNYMQKLKASLCQITQNTHNMASLPTSSRVKQSLVCLLASKLDGKLVQDTDLRQVLNASPPAAANAQQPANEPSQSVPSVAKSSVSCTPSPDIAAQQAKCAKLRDTPRQAMTALRRSAAGTASGNSALNCLSADSRLSNHRAWVSQPRNAARLTDKTEHSRRLQLSSPLPSPAAYIDTLSPCTNILQQDESIGFPISDTCCGHDLDGQIRFQFPTRSAR